LAGEAKPTFVTLPVRRAPVANAAPAVTSATTATIETTRAPV